MLPWFPVIPALALIFMLTPELFQKVSFDTFHPKEMEGKKPYLFLAVNLDEPSVLADAVTKYLLR